MQYKIIQSTDPQAVIDKINEEIADGWVPLGGIAISAWYQDGSIGSVDRFAQALIKSA